MQCSAGRVQRSADKQPWSRKVQDGRAALWKVSGMCEKRGDLDGLTVFCWYGSWLALMAKPLDELDKLRGIGQPTSFAFRGCQS